MRTTIKLLSALFLSLICLCACDDDNMDTAACETGIAFITVDGEYFEGPADCSNVGMEGGITSSLANNRPGEVIPITDTIGIASFGLSLLPPIGSRPLVHYMQAQQGQSTINLTIIRGPVDSASQESIRYHPEQGTVTVESQLVTASGTMRSESGQVVEFEVCCACE